MATPFSKKVEILGDYYALSLLQGTVDDDFIKYNDISFPICHFVNTGLIDESGVTDNAKRYIDETWLVFTEALEVTDKEFDSLAELLEYSENK